MSAEQEGIPAHFVEVQFLFTDENKDEIVIGYVDEVVLNLHAEGKIEHLPVLTVDSDRLVVRYYDIDSVHGLKTYPTLDQLNAVMPEQQDDEFQSITEASGRLEQGIPVVPVGGDPDAHPGS